MTGSKNFDDYYKKKFGSRWLSLKESLLNAAVTIPYSEGLAAPYYMDGASILAALLLRLPELNNDKNDDPHNDSPLLLDACAAPGGKTLVIASRMNKNTRLLANEISVGRQQRLKAVVDKHLFPDKRSRVQITGFDAAAAAGRKSERGRFAALLLDAPCSSERHVVQNKNALEKWTPARPRFLARRQWALLSAAFLLLAPGGSLVYATCSLNPEENDRVAEKLIKKYGETGKIAAGSGLCILDKPDFTEGEATEYGRIILPDTSEGAGPLYVARFRKGL